MYIAIDLGGTKTLVAALDDSGAIKKAVKFPTPQNYGEFLPQLQSTINEVSSDETPEAVCMAIPGTVDREHGLILQLGNLTWPRDIAIKADLASLVSCPILLENDANLAALSEAKLVEELYRKVLYITISTGIGSGFVVDGKLEENLIDSEIGHTQYEYNGQFIEWEDFASGSWIVKTYGKKASELDDEKAWRQISHNIAIGLVNTVNTLDPDVIIIGGGVGTHLPKFQPFLEEAITSMHNYQKMPPIIQAQRPEEAVIYGCYQLIVQQAV